MPAPGDILLAEGGANRDRPLAEHGQSRPTAFVTRLSAARARQLPGSGLPATHGRHHAVASQLAQSKIPVRSTIARAFLRDAPILLDDEATAALDAQNQAIIAEAIAGFRGKRTLIVIAHQLSTVAMADQIVVLDDGAIVEQGTPAQLREASGVYARFIACRSASRGWRIASRA